MWFSGVKEILLRLKAHIAQHTTIVGEFNTTVFSMDKSGKHKLNRDTVKLTEGLYEMDLIHIFRTFHPKSKEYNFFPEPHSTFSKIDHLIGHKTGEHK